MNMTGTILSNEVIRSIGWMLVHSLWQAAAISILAGLLLIIMRRSSARVRYLLSFAALVLVVLSSVATFLLYYLGDGIRAGREELADMALYGGISIPSSLAPQSVQGQGWFGIFSAYLEANLPLIVLVWFGGSAFLLLRRLGGFLYIQRIKHYRTLEVGKDLQERVSQLAGKLGIDRMVRVLESAIIEVPVAIGYIRPVILLPLGIIVNIPVQQLEAILLHELAHIRRRDYLLNIIQSVIEAVFFFNPAVWWISGNIRMEREHVCDDITVQNINNSLDYIKALTTMERSDRNRPLFAPAFGATGKKLLYRVRRILSPESTGKYRPKAAVFTSVLTAGALVFMTAAAFTIDDHSAGTLSASLFENSKLAGTLVTGQPGTSLKPSEIVLGIGSATLGTPMTVKALASGTAYLPVPPDTTRSSSDKEKEEAMKKAEEAKKIAQENLERAREEHEKAMQEYRKAMQEERELMYKEQEDMMKEVERRIVIVQKGDSTITIKLDSLEGLGLMYDIPGIEMEDDFEVLPFDKGHAYIYKTPGRVRVRPHDAEWDVFIDRDCDVDKDIQMRYFDSGEMEMQFQEQFEETMRQSREMERELREMNRHNQEYLHQFYPQENVFMWKEKGSRTDKIIMQELKDDGLVSPGREYVVEIGSKGMFINGQKQPREVTGKYRKLYEGLEGEGQGDFSYKLVF